MKNKRLLALCAVILLSIALLVSGLFGMTQGIIRAYTAQPHVVYPEGYVPRDSRLQLPYNSFATR